MEMEAPFDGLLAVHRLSSYLKAPGNPRTPIPEECRALAVACVAGV